MTESQIVTVDRSDLTARMGRLEASAMGLVDTGLRRVLELR